MYKVHLLNDVSRPPGSYNTIHYNNVTMHSFKARHNEMKIRHKIYFMIPAILYLKLLTPCCATFNKKYC